MPRLKICIECEDAYEGYGTRCMDCSNAAKFARTQRRGSGSRRYPREYQDNRSKLLKTYNRCAIQIPGVCLHVATTADHIKPLSQGGTHELENLQPACKPCNSAKRDRSMP